MSDIVSWLRAACARTTVVDVRRLDEAAARIEQLEADQRDTTEEFRLLSHDFGKALLMIEQLEAALREIERLDDQPECCGRGIGGYSGPPECCGDLEYGIDRAQFIARAALGGE